jgi:hypothetical protein
MLAVVWPNLSGHQCRFDAATDAPRSACGTCSFTTPSNYADFLYYIEVTLTRSTMSLRPQALTLRLY